MVKFGNIKCPNCGQEVKKTRMSRHKCQKLDSNRKEKCSVCSKEVKLKNFSRHYKRCRAKSFWVSHKNFFLYLLKAVRSFNRELLKERYIGSKDAQKQLICRQMNKDIAEIDLRKNRDFLKEVIRVEENELLKNARKTAEEYGFKLDHLEDSEAIIDAISFSAPRLSCRQIIFDFLKNINIEDENTLYFIDKKLIKKDYPTDEELKENENLYRDILEARNKCGYYIYYEKFYYLLVDYYNKRETNRCTFCGKFETQIKIHLRRCIPFRNHFYKNEEEAIKYFLCTFYNAKLWEEYKLFDYINFYKQYSFNYFMETVEKRLKNRNAFMEKIAEGKRKLREMVYCKPYSNKKDFIKNLIEEIDAWHPKIFEEEKEKEEKEREEKEKEFKEDLLRKENDIFEKALKEVEDEDKKFKEKMDEEKIRNTWALLLDGKFKAKLEEKNDENISSSEESEEDEEDCEERDIKELKRAAISFDK